MVLQFSTKRAGMGKDSSGKHSTGSVYGGEIYFFEGVSTG
jgi:hypothetical protein